MDEDLADTQELATAYAHTKDGTPPPEWQPLEEHLRQTALLAGTFAARFDGREWGELAGMWHDLGKYSQAFQTYLRASSGLDGAGAPQRTDHKSAGAQHAVEASSILGHLLAYTIAGHHGGMPNGVDEQRSLDGLLRLVIPAWKQGLRQLPKMPEPPPTPCLAAALGKRDAFGAAFFTRMLFSCLVDADFLDTERFMAPERAASRYEWPKDVLNRMEESLETFVGGLSGGTSTVEDRRHHVREACLTAAIESPGLFSLTVPTGGGKTLSSLAFALRHAIQHGLDRVIYVAPFTSIIEQNAEVFRKAMGEVSAALGQDVVVEHHSNIDVEKMNETVESRLATENWDAPLIVTTSVQFYESLFHNKPSRCRRIHRIARSVVVLDEVQTLPVQLLEPCLRALRELVSGYRTTIVLCTATQPALHVREGFHIGLTEVREIIPDPQELASGLKRVRVEDLGDQTDEQLVSRMLAEEQVLCIVNTRSHARDLYTLLGEDEAHVHLSALMIPAHRSEVLRRVHEKLGRGETCRLVATQLIEAGVDIDFPVVLRSLAGLDSIAQAAGRCNRNGMIEAGGRTYIFRSGRTLAERFIRETQDAAGQILSLESQEDPLSLKAIEHYFKLYYWSQSSHWDEKQILQRFVLDPGNPKLPFLFDFATCAEDFHLIEQSGCPVIIPWGEKGRQLCERLRHTGPLPPRDVLRQLQRYTVQIPVRTWEQYLERGIEVLHGRFAVLTSPELHYLDEVGLDLDNSDVGSLVF